MAPASSSSTPAISRSNTVLPPPEGPDTATISPASTASETSSSTAPLLNPLLTLRSSICAIGSAFHSAEGEPFDKIALGVERDRQGRRHREDDGGGDLSVLDARARDESQRADRHRLFVGGRQDQREHEIVPAENKGQQAGGR